MPARALPSSCRCLRRSLFAASSAVSEPDISPERASNKASKSTCPTDTPLAGEVDWAKATTTMRSRNKQSCKPQDHC